MKRYIVILLLVLYTASSSGMTLYIHFCCGKVDTVSVSKETHVQCLDSSDQQSECCESESIDLKVTSEQETTSKYYFTDYPSKFLKVSPDSGNERDCPQLKSSLIDYPPSSNTNGTPLFIKYCVLRN